ncbi:MAG: HAD family hydrolase [Phycisphaerae bacterium]|nr:HAD family hydrolase [Phycisphaerae bacterium]
MSNTAVFLDRDGTLIHDPGYLNHPDQVQVIDGVAEALKEFQLLGYKRVVASNQSGVARGVVSIEMLERIHDRLRELLAVKGASVDAIYYCPHHPDGTIPEYRKDSDWRKPKPGMLLAAAKEMDLDLSRSWMIGDNERDVEAGRSAGCKTILIGSTASGNVTASETRPSADPEKSKPDYVAVNIKEAVNIIKRHRRTLADRRTTPVPEMSPVSDERTLAAKSAEILAMPRERGPEAVPCVAGVPPSNRGQDARDTAPAPAALVPPAADPAKTEQLLTSILEQLRRMQTRETFGEFSLTRLLAGIVQAFVPLCLLLALWFLLGSKRQDNSVFMALSFAAVLQVMALTFYIMHDRR